MAEADRYRTYFDEAWKKVLERFFPELLRFFLPALADGIDFSQAVTFLDSVWPPSGQHGDLDRRRADAQ